MHCSNTDAPDMPNPHILPIRNTRYGGPALFPISRNDPGPNPLQVLIPISVAAWVLFGASCILCINGKGRAGRWVPEWYLDSEGSHWDRALVAAWWLAVMLLWPVILPVLLVGKLVRALRKVVAERCARKKAMDEEEAATAAAQDMEEQRGRTLRRSMEGQ